MTKKRKILTDIDGVCLNWVQAFDRFMKNQGYIKILDHVEHEALGDRYGISKDEAFRYVEIFNAGHWEFGTLPPEEGAVEAVRHLVKNLEFQLIGITSCSTSPQTVALRKANLYNVFGNVFHEVHCVDVGESKRTHLADHDSCFWIEDKLSACIDGLDYGHDCILMSKPWNQDQIDSRIKRCYSWTEILDYIRTRIES